MLTTTSKILKIYIYGIQKLKIYAAHIYFEIMSNVYMMYDDNNEGCMGVGTQGQAMRAEIVPKYERWAYVLVFSCVDFVSSTNLFCYTV